MRLSTPLQRQGGWIPRDPDEQGAIFGLVDTVLCACAWERANCAPLAGHTSARAARPTSPGVEPPAAERPHIQIQCSSISTTTLVREWRAVDNVPKRLRAVVEERIGWLPDPERKEQIAAAACACDVTSRGDAACQHMLSIVFIIGRVESEVTPNGSTVEMRTVRVSECRRADENAFSSCSFDWYSTYCTADPYRTEKILHFPRPFSGVVATQPRRSTNYARW